MLVGTIDSPSETARLSPAVNCVRKLPPRKLRSDPVVPLPASDESDVKTGVVPPPVFVAGLPAAGPLVTTGSEPAIIVL